MENLDIELPPLPQDYALTPTPQSPRDDITQTVSPQTSNNSPAERNDEDKPKIPRSALLAKRRLQSFCNLKMQQSLNMSPFKKQQNIAGVFGAGADLIDSKVQKEASKKNQSKKGQKPIERAKTVIEEIEEIKKQEFKQDLSLAGIKDLGASTTITDIDGLIITIPPVSEENHFKKREVKYRNYRGNYRRSPSPEYISSQRKPNYPTNWTEFKNNNFSFNYIRELNADRSKPKKYMDYAKQLRFETNSVVMESLKVDSLQGDKKYIPFHQVRYTRAEPRIAYSPLHVRSKVRYLKRTEVFDVVRKDVKQQMLKIMNNETVVKFKPEKPVSVRRWYPKNWKIQDHNESRLSENSLGLSFLLNYADDNEEEEEETENIKSVDKLKESKKDDQPAKIEVTKTVTTTTLNKENEDKGKSESKQYSSDRENDNEERKLSKDRSSNQIISNAAMDLNNSEPELSKNIEIQKIEIIEDKSKEDIEDKQHFTPSKHSQTELTLSEDDDAANVSKETNSSSSKLKSEIPASSKKNRKEKKKKGKKSKKSHKNESRKTEDIEKELLEIEEKLREHKKNSKKQKLDPKKKIEQPTVESDKDTVSIKKSHESKKKKKKREKVKKYKSPEEDSDDSDDGESKKKKYKEKKKDKRSKSKLKKHKKHRSTSADRCTASNEENVKAAVVEKKKKKAKDQIDSSVESPDHIEAAEDSQTPELIKTSSKDDICLSDLGDFDIAKEEFKLEKSIERELQTNKVKSKSKMLPDEEVEKNEKEKPSSKPEEEKPSKILDPRDEKLECEVDRSPVHKPKAISASASKKKKSTLQEEPCKTDPKQPPLTLNAEKVFDLREKINKRKSRRSVDENRDKSDSYCLKKCKEVEFGERKVWRYENFKIDVNYFDIEKDPGTPPMPNESRSENPESTSSPRGGKQKTPDTDDYHSFWESEDEPRRKSAWDSEEDIPEHLRNKVKNVEKQVVKSPPKPKLPSPKRPPSPLEIPLCIKPFSRSSRNRWDKSHDKFQINTPTEIKLVVPEQESVTEKNCEIAVEREKIEQFDKERLESVQRESKTRDKKLVDSNEWEDESNDHIPRDILHKRALFDNIMTSTPSTQSKNEEYSLDNSLTSISSAELSFDKISQRSTTPNVLENQYEEFLKAVSTTDLPEGNIKGEIKSLTPVKKKHEISLEHAQTKSPVPVVVKVKGSTSDLLSKTDVSQFSRPEKETKPVQKVAPNEISTAQIVPAPVPSPKIDSNVFSIPTLDLTRPAFVQVEPENKNDGLQKPFTFTAMTLPSKKVLLVNSALKLNDDSNSDDDITHKFKSKVEDLRSLPDVNKKNETVVKSGSDSKSPSKATAEREIPAIIDDVDKYIDKNALIPCISPQKDNKSKVIPPLPVQKVTELVGLSLKRSRSRSPIKPEQKPFADKEKYRHNFDIASKKEYSPRRRRSMSPRKISPPRHKSPKRRRYSPSRKSPDFRKFENRRSPDHPFKLRNRSPSMSPRRQHSPRRPTSPGLRMARRSASPRKRSLSPRKRSLSPRRISISPRRRSISPRNRSISPRKRSISPRNCSPKRRKMSPLHERKDQSPKRRPISPPRKPSSPIRRPLSPLRRPVSPLRKPLSPLRRPVSPLRRPVSPLRRPVSPLRRPVSPLRRPVSPLRKPLSPPRKHREVSPRVSQRSYTDLEVRPRSPASSPLQSLKKSVADSTISDDLLLLRNSGDCGESPSFRKNRYEIGGMAPNESMSQSAHYKKESKLETSMDYTNYTDCTYNQSFYDQYGQYMQYSQYNQSFPANKTQSVPSKTTASHVVQVGNVLEVVPTENLEACTSKRTVRNYTKIQPAESTQKIVQVGNMLQIVPHSDDVEKTVPKVASEPPNLSVAEIDKVDVAKIDPNILAKPEPRPEDIEKQSAEDLMKQKAAERRAEREKRRQERENRRKEKEKKRKEKEKKKQIKLKLKTENIIKKALLVEAGLEFDDDHNAEVDLTPVPIIITDDVDGKEPIRSILISTLDKSEDDIERQMKSVSFADGIRPGEGTSPSGGEDLASPPPPTFSSARVPKKDKKKKIKIPKKIKKKKVRVKVIKRPSIDDSSEDDNLPPPPPPPGSPPSHLFPPRVKTHTLNNVPPAVIPGLLSLLRPPPPPVQDPPCPPTPTQPVFRAAPSPVSGPAYGQTTGAGVMKYMRQLSSSSQSSTSAATTPQINSQSPFPYPQPYHQNKLHTSQLMQTNYSTPNPNLQYIHPVINQTQFQIPQRSPIQSQYHVPQPSPVQNQYMVNTQNPPPVSTPVLQQSIANQQYQPQQQVLYSHSHPPLQQQSHNVHMAQSLGVQMLRKSEEKKSSSPRERRSSRSRRSRSKSPQRRRGSSSAYSRHDSGKLRRSRSSSSSEYRHCSDRDSRDRRRKR